MSDLIDLRSDTVTRPSAEMRAAIAAAPVGDDQFGEDPTVNLLQERTAALLGKDASLWLPTGTMANQVALRALTRPGDDVIVSQESHAVWHETGASGANAGVQFTAIGRAGVFTPEEFAAAGLHAIDHNIERLAEDHANVRLIAERLSTSGKVLLDLDTVRTNILVFDLAEDAPDAPTVVARAKERGLLLFAFGLRTIRAVTHLDVSRRQCERAAGVCWKPSGASLDPSPDRPHALMTFAIKATRSRPLAATFTLAALRRRDAAGRRSGSPARARRRHATVATSRR